MKLQQSAYRAARNALLGDDGMALAQLMHDLAIGNAPSGAAPPWDLARELGWVDSDHVLTAEGQAASDSCREYVFWLGRQRRLPFDEDSGALPPELFRDRDVLEIGSGMGTNLMSLAGIASSAKGVEPYFVYNQYGRIFREREGLPEPEVLEGSGERIPYPDASFDIVLCVSAHQYFDVCAALRECARVVRPGGELVIVGGVLGKYVGEIARDLPVRPRVAKAAFITIANTLSYMALRRRIIGARGRATTSRPIYPAAAYMGKWMREAGFRVKVAGTPVANERLFRGSRLAPRTG